jgi:phage-related protein
MSARVPKDIDPFYLNSHINHRMVRIPPDEDEKPLRWVGTSLEDLRRFPSEVQDDVGAALSAAQFGAKATTAKPWKGSGPGIFEVVEDFRTDTYRAVYTVRFEHAVYVPHAFQKKSPRGIKTDQRNIEMVERRLQSVRKIEADTSG